MEKRRSEDKKKASEMKKLERITFKELSAIAIFNLSFVAFPVFWLKASIVGVLQEVWEIDFREK